MLFGITALLVVGASWCLVGIVMGRAPKEGIDNRLIQLSTGMVAVLAAIIIATFFLPPPACPRRILALTLLDYAVSGMLNYWGMVLMGEGMQRGPNGAVWGVMQSAFVAPFAVGVIFFGVAFTLPRAIGLVAVVCGLAFFAVSKGGSPVAGAGRGRLSWKFFAFMSFTTICFQQSLSTLPSYFEECRVVSPVLRSLAGAGGSLCMAATNIFAAEIRDGRNPLRLFSGWRKPRFWVYVLSMQFFSLIFAYTLLYPGMDRLAELGMGALSYPLMVGSCIFSFSLYAVLALREKITKAQILALVFCFIGLVCFCL